MQSFTQWLVNAFIRACIHLPLQLVIHSHSSMYSFIQCFICHSCIFPLIHSSPCIYSCSLSLIHSFVCSFIPFFIQTPSHPLIHLSSRLHFFNHLIFQSFTCSFFHCFTHSIIFSFFHFFSLFSLHFSICLLFHVVIDSFIFRSFAPVLVLPLWDYCVFVFRAGSMHHSYTGLSLSHPLIHERFCTFTHSSVIHRFIHSKVARPPCFAHALCHPVPRSLIAWPTTRPLTHSRLPSLTPRFLSPSPSLSISPSLSYALLPSFSYLHSFWHPPHHHVCLRTLFPPGSQWHSPTQLIFQSRTHSLSHAPTHVVIHSRIPFVSVIPWFSSIFSFNFPPSHLFIPWPHARAHACTLSLNHTILHSVIPEIFHWFHCVFEVRSSIHSFIKTP